MQKNIRFDQYLKCIFNSIKKITLSNLIFPLLFVISIFLLFKTQNNTFFYLLILFLGYVFNLILSITKTFYKKVYWLFFIISGVIFLWSTLSLLRILDFSFLINKQVISINLNFLFHPYLISLTFFIITQRAFYYFWNLILPYQKQTKMKQFIYQKYIRLKENILHLKISLKTLFIANILVTAFIVVLYFFEILKFDTNSLISYDALLQTNATIYTLVLTITVAILGNNKYLRKIQPIKILFSGINLIFFITYTALVLLCIVFPFEFLFIISFFMLINAFIFMMHLIDNQKIGHIINYLNKIVYDNFSRKNFNPNITSTKNKLLWNNVKGMNIESGSIDKYEEFKSAFDSLEEIGLEAEKNGDRKIFLEVIRNYFEIGRYFLYQCDKESKKYLATYLSPIWGIYNSIKSNKEYRQIIINSVLNDYRCSEHFLDIKVWNLERFKLMVSIFQSTSEKNEKNYITSILIKMLTIRMVEKMQIRYNDFSNQSYKQFQNTDEFMELRKSLKKNKTSWQEVQKNLKMFKFQDKNEQKEYDDATKSIIDELKKK